MERFARWTWQTSVPDKHIWLTKDADETLRRLARRWGLSDSATIAEALKRALAGDS